MSIPSQTLGIVPVSSPDFIYAYTLANPNVTAFGVTFDIVPTPSVNWRYQVWYNASQTSNSSDLYGHSLLSVYRGIDEAICKQH